MRAREGVRKAIRNHAFNQMLCIARGGRSRVGVRVFALLNGAWRSTPESSRTPPLRDGVPAVSYTVNLYRRREALRYPNKPWIMGAAKGGALKRRAIFIGVTVAVVALAVSLTTARARQASSENNALMHLQTQQRAVARLIAHARDDGVPTADITPLVASADRLTAARPPSSFPVFGTERSLFYQHQTSEFRALAVRIRRAVRAATLKSRGAAQSELARLGHDVTRARALGAQTSNASATLASLTHAVQGASVPRRLDAITADVRSQRGALAVLIQRQRRAIEAVIARGGGTRAGVDRLANGASSSIDYEMSLLSLFTDRPAAYRRNLAQLTADVQAQPTAARAAVKEMRLEAQVAGVNADYGRTVPDKFILVSTESQSAALYENGRVIYSTPVTTGGPELPTDHGVFHIYFKASPFVFHSPWPLGSPYYYPPTPVDYWMPFDGGEGLHDASWRSNFGPGSNVAPTDLGTGRTILGTHGCVNLPHAAAALIWDWAPVGTTVVVV